VVSRAGSAEALEAAQYDGGTGDVGSDLGHEAVIS